MSCPPFYKIQAISKIWILSAVTLKITIVWDVTPSSLVEIYRCFGATCCFHLQDGRVFYSQQTLDVKMYLFQMCLYLNLFP
jgi:hypothetical protein